jgi:hypothetical protein
VSVVHLLWKALLIIMIQLLRHNVNFRKHFNIGRNGKVLKRQTILNRVNQFRSTASALSKKNPGRPRSVRIPENVEKVRVALQQSPPRSATNSLR